MQRASPLNSGRDRATLSQTCCPLLHPASARAVLLVVSSLVFFLRPSAYLLPFLRGFCLRWKGNHGALRVTGPAVFFSSREDQPPPPSPRLSFSRFILPFLFFFVPSAALVRPETPSSPTCVMTKSCTSVNCHPPLPVFSG